MSYQIKQVVGLRLLVSPNKQEELEKKGDIILVEDKDKAMRPLFGTIFQIGGKVNTELKNEGEQELEVGNVIAYDRNTYPKVSVDGEEYDLIQKVNYMGLC